MESKNELVVGLDVGSNSVGWAVVELHGQKLEKIHAMGSRIIPMGDEKKEFEQEKKGRPNPYKASQQEQFRSTVQANRSVPSGNPYPTVRRPVTTSVRPSSAK